MKTIQLSDDELAAVRDFLPRISVTNSVSEGTPLHTALLKLSPSSLPTSLRYDENGRDRSLPAPRKWPKGCVGDPGVCPHGCFYRCDG